MKFFNFLLLIFDSVSVSVSVIPFPFPDSGFHVLVLPVLQQTLGKLKSLQGTERSVVVLICFLGSF